MMDGSSWSQLLDRAKAAYPKNGLKADINKKKYNIPRTREDLAVSIYGKKLATTNKEILEYAFGVPWPRLDMIEGKTLWNYGGLWKGRDRKIFQPQCTKKLSSCEKKPIGGLFTI